MKNFEAQMQNLEEILTSLTKDDLKLSEVTKLVKKAKELYDVCNKQLEEAKLEIEEVTSVKTNN